MQGTQHRDYQQYDCGHADPFNIFGKLLEWNVLANASKRVIVGYKHAELMNARTVVTPHTMTPNTFRRMRLRRWRHQHSPSHRISSNVSRANSSCKTRRTSKRSRHLFFCQFLDREDAASGNRHDPARLRVVGVIEIADALTDDLDVVIVLQEPSERRALNRPRPRQRRQVLPGRQRLTRAPLLPQEPSSSTSNP
jgi:hypothetical protein